MSRNSKHWLTTSLLQPLPLDPFHLDFRACIMDWRVKSAGSGGGGGGGGASAGLLAERIAVFPIDLYIGPWYFPSTVSRFGLAVRH